MNPERLRLAREISGLTQTELARKVEGSGLRKITQSTIAGIETGRWEPAAELLEALAQATGFTTGFFELDDPPDFPSGSLVLFRSRAAVSAKEETQVRRHAQLATELVLKLTRNIPALPVRIPQLEGLAPVEAAQITRSMLGRSPDTPILDLVRTLEKAGVIFLALPAQRDPIDAFSAWVDARIPCIALLANSAPDRQRFSIAHELGHLVMHRVIRGAHVEDEANLFAAELLTPRDTLAEEFSTPVTMSQLLSLKSRWHVSMRSLVNTGAVAGVISNRHRVSLFQRLNHEYGGRSEPSLFPPERPRGLMQLMEMRFGKPLRLEVAAREFNLPVERLSEALSGYIASSDTTGRVIQFPAKR